MLGYGCIVCQYLQIYYLDLDKYQLLPRLYLGYFEVYPVGIFTKEKRVSDLAFQVKQFVRNDLKNGTK